MFVADWSRMGAKPQYNNLIAFSPVRSTPLLKERGVSSSQLFTTHRALGLGICFLGSIMGASTLSQRALPRSSCCHHYDDGLAGGRSGLQGSLARTGHSHGAVPSHAGCCNFEPLQFEGDRGLEQVHFTVRPKMERETTEPVMEPPFYRFAFAAGLWCERCGRGGREALRCLWCYEPLPRPVPPQGVGVIPVGLAQKRGIEDGPNSRRAGSQATDAPGRPHPVRAEYRTGKYPPPSAPLQRQAVRH